MIDRVAAAGLERILLGQLTNQLLENSVDGPYAAQVEDSFADALAKAGGLGLADALSRGAK